MARPVVAGLAMNLEHVTLDRINETEIARAVDSIIDNST